MHARYYNPLLGRFLSTDPVDSSDPTKPQTWNRYAYARNNPMARVDPDGLSDINNLAYAQEEAEFYARATAEEKEQHVRQQGTAFLAVGTVASLLVPDPSDLVLAGIAGRAGGFLGRLIGRGDEVVEAYSRAKHYGKTPTSADRRALGAGADEVVDHNPPLVKRYYDGDPARGGGPEYRMSQAERRASAHDRSRMRIQSKRDSCIQGGHCRAYSEKMKRFFGIKK